MAITPPYAAIRRMIMTNLKRLLALLMALAMCFALAACGGDNADPSDSPSPDPAVDSSEDPSDEPSPSPEIEVDLSVPMYEFASGLPDGDTAVTVNGEAVPNEQYFYWLAYDCYNMDFQFYYTYGFNADYSDDYMRSLVLQDVRDLVTFYTVMRQLCRQEGVDLTEEQQAEIQSQIDEYGLDSILRDFGMSEESFRTVASNSYLFSNYGSHIMGEPTAADLEQYVADNGIFSAKHILLMTTDEDVTGEDGTTQTADEYNAAQRALAEDLLSQIQSASDPLAKFDELMNEYSEDGGLAANPDGYTFSNSDSLVGGFREAALELEPGELSGIVETDYGYHIMLRQSVDASAYHDEWLSDGVNAAVSAAAETAEVTVADAINDLDVASFYDRYMAYGSALYSSQDSDN